MSEENVETVRRAFAEYKRGDLEGALDEWAPDAVWDWSNGHGFDAGVYRGRDEIRAFWQERQAAWEEVRFELVDLLEVEDDRCDRGERRSTRGVGTGSRLRRAARGYITFRDGKQTSLTLYQTKQEALEAAGLRE